MKKLIFTLSIVLLTGASVLAADYFWVGGTGNWNDFATHWATESGGSTFHTQAPTQNDDVFFDGNSFTATGAVMTISTEAFCKNMDWSGISNNPTLAGTADLHIYGSLSLAPDINRTYYGNLYFEATEPGQTVFTGGLVLNSSVHFQGEGGGWTLMDGLDIGWKYLTFDRGSLNTNNFPVNAQYIFSSSGEIRILSLGSSVITLSGTNTQTLRLNGSNLIFDAGTSLIDFSGSGAGMYANGTALTFYDVLFSSPDGKARINQNSQSISHTFNSLTFMGSAILYNSNTIGTLSLSPGKKYTFYSQKTQTILNELMANGTESEFIIMNGGTFYKENGAVTVEWVLLENNNATGEASFTASNSFDLGNNSGWIITPPPPKTLYWVGGTGNWNEPEHWSLSSGGGGGAGIPTLLDDVYFDSNSFTAANQTITLVGDADNNLYCRNMNWTGVSNNPTLSGSGYLHIYGSLSLSPDMSGTFSGSIYFLANEPGQTVFTGGLVLNSDIIFQGEGGGWTLMDGLNIAEKKLYLIKGTFNTNDQPVVASKLYSYGSNQRGLILGSSLITLSLSPVPWSSEYTLEMRGTNLIFDAGTSMIIFTGENARINSNDKSGLTYHDVLFDNPNGSTRLNTKNDTFNSVDFNGNGSMGANSTIGTLKVSPGKQYSFSDTINILNDFIANGTSSEFIIIERGTFYKESGDVTVEWVSLENSNATGGATFTANNSLDMGNNTGWIINPPPPKDYFWVGGTGNWNDAAHWSLASGGSGGAGIPTLQDNVNFDENSFTAADQTLTLVGDAAYSCNCHDMDWTGVTNNPTLAELAYLHIYGSLTLSPNMSYNSAYNGRIYFEATEPGQEVFTGGLALNSDIYFQGEGGEWTLMDELNIGTKTLHLVQGSLNTNDKTVHAGRFYSHTSNTRQLTLGSTSMFLSYNSSNNNYTYDVSGTNFLLDAGTSVIHLTGSDARMIHPAGATFHDLIFENLNGTGALQVTDGNFNNITFNGNGFTSNNQTIGTLILSPGKRYRLGIQNVITILNDLVAIGNENEFIIIECLWDDDWTTNIHKESGSITVEYVSLRGINATGEATFTANNSLDLGYNTGWIINPPPPKTFYWVGGTGNWNEPAHWSLASGGTGGAGVPTLQDDVNFDVNSFTAIGQTLTIVGDAANNANCRNMDWTGVSNNPTLTNINYVKLHIYGSLSLSPNMNSTYSRSIYFEAKESDQTVFTGGLELQSDIYFQGEGGGWTLMDELNIGAKDLYLVRGSLNTNDKAVNAGRFLSDYSNQRSLTLGATLMSLSTNYSNNKYTYDVSGTNLLLDAGTSTISFTGTNARMSHSSGGTFYNVIFENANGEGYLDVQDGIFNSITFNGNAYITRNNTIGTLIFSPGKQYTLRAGYTQTILNELVANGTCAEGISIESSSTSQATISKQNGTVAVSYANLQGINAEGGAVFEAQNSLDMGNNSGWTFTSVPLDLYWVGGTGNWDNVNHWASESGGVGGYCMPGQNDNVFFDENSFTQITQGVFINVGNAECNNMNWTGAINAPTFTSSSASNNLTIYGSLILNPNVNFTFSGKMYFKGEAQAKESYLIDMAGKSFSNEVYFEGEGGEWTLQNAFSISNNDLYLNQGTLNTNDKTVTVRKFISTNSNPRGLVLGASLVNISSGTANAWNVSGANMSIAAGTSAIRLSAPNAGFVSTGASALAYNKVIFQSSGGSSSLNSSHTFDEVEFAPAGTLTGGMDIRQASFNNDALVQDNNTFGTLGLTSGHTYQFEAGTTQTIDDDLEFWGSAANPIHIRSLTEGVQANFSKAEGVVSGNYIHLRDMNATGGADFDVYNSEDLSNNTGWNFLEPPIATCPLDMEMCENATPILLNMAAPAGWDYSGEGVYYDETDEVYMFDPSLVANTASTITYTIGGLFPGSCEFMIAILRLPVVECPDNMEVCAGSDYINLYEGSGWYYYDGDMITGFDPVEAGIYTITYTETNECGNTSCDFLITVSPSPEAMISGETEFCEGGSSILTASGGIYYLWNTGATTAEIEVNESGYYSVTVTDETGCTAIAEVEVTEHPLPVAVISGDLEICDGESTQLTASGGLSYLWSTGETEATITLSDAGLYSVTATDEHGCEGYAEVVVNVHPLPEVEITGLPEFCVGDDPFTLTGGAPEGGIYYIDGEQFSVFNPQLPGTYELVYVYSDAFGCTNSALAELVVHPQPEVTLDAFPDLCIGAEPIMLTSGLPEGGVYYIDGTAAQTFNPELAGTYQVIYEYHSAFGCPGSDTVAIVVHPLPEVEITGNFSFCIAASTELTASAGLSYLWSTGETTQVIVVTETGLYWVLVTDENGCQGYAEATVSSEDNQDPVIIAPADLTLSADEGLCSAVIAELGEPIATDNCGIDTVTHNAPEVFPVGITEVIWIASDLAGNTAQDVQLVTVTDDQAPEIIAPQDLTVNADEGLCHASNVLLGEPLVDDNCGVASVVNDAPQVFEVGETEVTWVVTDVHGLSTQAVQLITVLDNQDPLITAPADMLVSADMDMCSAFIEYLGEAITDDNCGILSISNDAPTVFAVGTTEITWTVTDFSGNTAQAVQEVTVTDDQNPIIADLPDELIDTNLDFCYASNVVLIEPFVDDNCGIASLTNDAPEIYPIGLSEVTWTVTDIHGNTAQTSQLITVVDNQNPTIIAPDDLTIPVDPVGDFCSASNVELGTPIVIDNCTIDELSNNAPVIFPLGVTEVVWTVTDLSGNSAEAVQVITVSSDFLAEISGLLEFCEGESSLLTATEGIAYLWNTGETDRSITVDESATYSVEVTAPSACVSYAEAEVIVHPIPVVEISGEFELCEGETSLLTASDGAAYLWSTGETTQSISVTTSGEYEVEVRDENGCVGNSSVMVIFNPIPVAVITPVGPTVFCEGGFVELIASGGIDYLWSTGETTQSITVAETGEYSVEVTDENACTGFAQIQITIIPLPVLNCPEQLQFTIEDPLLSLDMSIPAGGVYTGIGVDFDGSAYYFNPAIGIGNYEITYCYSDPDTGCENCCVFIITVIGTEQEVCIPAGWSMISSYYQPDEPAMELIFEDLVAQGAVSFMLGEHGIFWPGQNINTLGNWDVFEAYKVKMNEAGCAIFSGEMPEEKTIFIKQGLNFVPVLCEQALSAQDVFGQLGDDLIYAFDIYDQLVYWPVGGIFTLQFLEPGCGYLISSKGAGEISFNCSKTLAVQKANPLPPVYQNTPWEFAKTGDAHLISISTNAIAAMQQGDIIGVFNQVGLCVGSTEVFKQSGNQLLVAYGDDQTTENVDGLIEETPMFFKVYSPESGDVYQAEVTFDTKMPNTNRYASNGQSLIKSIDVNPQAIGGLSSGMIQIHPNPNNGVFSLTLPGSGNQMTIEVFSASGLLIQREVIQPVNGLFVHKMDVSYASPGLYFVHVNSNKGTVVRKVVID